MQIKRKVNQLRSTKRWMRCQNQQIRILGQLLKTMLKDTKGKKKMLTMNEQIATLKENSGYGR